MRFLKTLLGGLALCAALLVWAGFTIGSEQPGSRAPAGLTAAAVLASDGMAPDGRTGAPSLDRAALGRLTGAVSDTKQGAAAAERPAG